MSDSSPHRPDSVASANPPGTIDRREAIRRVSLMLGGAALVGGTGLLTACESADRPAAGQAVGSFSVGDVAFLDEVAETILPETDTPGAKAAAVGAFMALMVTDTYDPGEQAFFREGMETLDAECRGEHGASFMDATPAQRLTLLERIDREALEPGAGPHYFQMMKQLTLLGYFTSEIGCTQAQRYVESPGRYDPCAPLEPGEPDWARHI